ncbi:MAG TPA: tetratricopeptide repeat protein [Xanthobacteraceae bacterium]|nr:tetratricopeptide repeat protein [Xanthobacteraceae bacterium]
MRRPSLTFLATRARASARRPSRFGSRVAGVLAAMQIALALALGGAVPGRAEEPVKGEVSVATRDGYARLVFRFPEEVDADVKLSGTILVITFKQPVQVGVDNLASNARDYIGAARRDPDGRGLRLALAQKVRVNSMAAGERLFVDLLPESWTGAPPSLPQEIVEDLARRAREAERKIRQQRQLANSRPAAAVRVRVGRQPTFTRYVFDLPELISIAAERGKGDLTLLFNAPLNFDIADALATLPPTVAGIQTERREDSTLVHFEFTGKADVRTFREDMDYVVDVGSAEIDTRPGRADAGRDKDAVGITPPETASAQAVAQVPVPPRRPDAAPPRPPPQQTPALAETPPQDGQAAARPSPVLEKPAPERAAKLPSANAAPSAGAAPPPSAVAAAAPPPDSPKKEEPSAPAASPEPPAPAKAAEKPIAAEAKPAVAEAKPAAAEPVEARPAPASAAPSGGPAPAPAADDAADTMKPSALPDPSAQVKVELRRQGENLRVVFPFHHPTPAAVFRRADTLWIVFDSGLKLDLAALNADTSRTVRAATVTRSREGQVVRIKLERPRLTSMAAEGSSWTVTIGDVVLDPTQPLAVNRNVVGPRATAIIPFDDPKQLHRLADPDVGDTLLVVTALGPARGFLKAQDFVEFRTLMSTHGVVLQPIADDLNVELAADKIVVGRPSGLVLSSGVQSVRRAGTNYRPVVFDAQLWGFDRQANFTERQRNLIQAAASAPETKRSGPRIDLARFYLEREMYAEAKAVLDVAIADEHPTADDATPLVLRAVANLMLGRPDDALKDLADPIVGDQHDAPLWRAVIHARQGKWPVANEAFKKLDVVVGTLPIELQRIALEAAVRAAIEVGDFAAAATRLDEFDTIGVPPELKPRIAVLTGRVAEGLGRTENALAAYREAADSSDRPAAAEGHLREIELRYKAGDLKRSDVIGELETLTTVWRGDQTEIEALQLLGRLYSAEGRYRDAFNIMRTALTAHPNSDMTRRIHDEAAATFDTLFLGGKGDTMPTIDALSLFYDFRELTPIGRRGDEMIRRLADRLVSVDLLDQAAELLQHQVDHRLQGAGRAQVATRLAVIYLMDRKPDRALATLRATRVAEVSNELRNQRLLLEARALSDLGRHDLALEVIAKMSGREAIRLRSDILWAAQRWREAAEQIELLYGDRWREWKPLDDTERADILRAAIGYALGEDKLGLERFREKFAAKMAEGNDRHAFDVVTQPLGSNSDEFRDIARTIAAVDTLDGFLRDMRARYPETGASTPSGTLPAEMPPDPLPNQDQSRMSTRETTGSIGPRYLVRPLATP